MEGQKQGNNLARINRNLLGRSRIINMKDLSSKHCSLMPTTQNSSVHVSLCPFLCYWNKQPFMRSSCREKIEKMRERKELLINIDQDFEPIMDIKYSLEHDTLEVGIISELKEKFLVACSYRCCGRRRSWSCKHYLSPCRQSAPELAQRLQEWRREYSGLDLMNMGTKLPAKQGIIQRQP